MRSQAESFELNEPGSSLDQPWRDCYWESCSPSARPGWAIVGSRDIGCDWSSPSASRTRWSSSRTRRCYRVAAGARRSPPQCRTRDSPRAAPSSRTGSSVPRTHDCATGSPTPQSQTKRVLTAPRFAAPRLGKSHTADVRASNLSRETRARKRNTFTDTAVTGRRSAAPMNVMWFEIDEFMISTDDILRGYSSQYQSVFYHLIIVK